jgi:hypothetical protein
MANDVVSQAVLQGGTVLKPRFQLFQAVVDEIVADVVMWSAKRGAQSAR